MPYLGTTTINSDDLLVLKVLASGDGPEGVMHSVLSSATGFKPMKIRTVMSRLIRHRYAFQRYGVLQYCITPSGREALRTMTATTTATPIWL